MLSSSISRAVGALALMAACGTASAATVALPGTPGVFSPTVTLDGWQFGAGVSVSGVRDGHAFNETAGGFVGKLLGAGEFSTPDFVSYCVELTEAVGFGSAIGGYSIVSGLDYFGSAATVDTLGRLMTYSATNRDAVANVSGSAAMQVAIWNTVYDDDQRLGQGDFRLTLKNQNKLIQEANALLLAAAPLTSQFDIYVLSKPGSQDLLLTVPTAIGGSDPAAVPEPGTAALGLLAFGAMGAALRRRRG